MIAQGGVIDIQPNEIAQNHVFAGRKDAQTEDLVAGDHVALSGLGPADHIACGPVADGHTTKAIGQLAGCGGVRANEIPEEDIQSLSRHQ